MVQAQPFSSFKTALPVLLLVLALGAISTEVGAQDAPASISPEAVRLRDGVLVDLTRRVVYTMKPGGGIEATELAGGSLVWSSAAASRPLALAGGLLLAQQEGGEGMESLELATLDSATGTLRSSTRLRIAAPLRTHIDDGLGRHFEIGAASGPQGWEVAWKASTQQIRGAQLEDEPEAGEALQIATGAALVDPASGTSLQPSRPLTLDVAPLIRLAPDASRIAGTSGEQYLSADGRHLLVSERIADNRVWNRWRWRVYEAGTGRALGRIDQPVSIAPFLVAGDLLLVESLPSQRVLATHDLIKEPLALRAFGLDSGRERWSRELRDTTYYGPYPP